MELSDTFLEQWETIVADVHKTDVPLECVKKIVFKLVGRRQKTINVHSLIKQGIGFSEIEALLTRMISELEPELHDIDFVLDIQSVAHMVQPETDKLLGKI